MSGKLQLIDEDRSSAGGRQLHRAVVVRFATHIKKYEGQGGTNAAGARHHRRLRALRERAERGADQILNAAHRTPLAHGRPDGLETQGASRAHCDISFIRPFVGTEKSSETSSRRGRNDPAGPGVVHD